MSVSKKILVLSSLLALGAGMSASAAPRINGAGASFPAKIYQRWFADLARSGGPQVNYQSVGSGSGRKAFIDQTVNFAASDDPMKKKDMAKVGRGVVQIPMVGGTIAFGFNKPGCDLKLTQTQAVRVAMGKVKNWKELAVSLALSFGSIVQMVPEPQKHSPIRWRPFHQNGLLVLVNL
jgi:phosphate transport system substrate-binding protein